MTERIPCCVPFCGRTTKARGFREWICADHWSCVPAEYKAERRRLDRIAARRGATDMDRMMAALAWRECKAAAVEVAAGLGIPALLVQFRASPQLNSRAF